MIELLATYARSEDLINLGAYKAGANPRLDKAVSMHQAMTAFLRQDVDERATMPESVAALLKLAERDA